MALLVCCLFACNKQNKVILKEGKAYFEYFAYSGSEDYYDEFPLSQGEFYNPILSGFFPDPSICRKGDDFYIVNSTFSFFPCIPVFHSTDLANWKQIGHVLDRAEQFPNTDQPVSYGIFAPAITYNPHNETFYMTTTYVGGGGNFVVTAKDPAGPWSNPIWLPEVQGIDPSLFFDEDGRAYIVNNQDPEGEILYKGHKAIWIQEYNVETNQTFGPRKVLRNGGHNLAEKPIWIEGPHIYKINGYYYLMAAEGGTSIDHRQVIFRSRNVMGPYETNPSNPILTQRDLDRNRKYPITNAGHADLIETPSGAWYSIFLACRPYTPENHFNIGRETFILPVSWNEDSWPVILDKGLEIPMILNLPEGVALMQDIPGYMQQGNFSFVEYFKSEKLPLEWMFLRTPVEKWHESDLNQGGIWLEARPANLRERKQPSFIGTRQRHHNFNAETSLHFLPKGETDLAGLVLFQNEGYHLTLGVTKDKDDYVVVLQKAEKVQDEITKLILNKVVLPNSFRGRICLQASCKSGEFNFSYKLSDDQWIVLADKIDAKYLSTEIARGFIGTILGLYASSNE